MHRLQKTARALVVALHVVSPFVATHNAFALTGDVQLPAPAVSRALDAVLLPIDAQVAKAFGLGQVRSGVLVLAVQPGGVAEKQGIQPGDVLQEILGRRIARPLDVDAAVARGLKTGNNSYDLQLSRAGAVVPVTTLITLASFEEAFAVSDISRWESWTETTSFSYAEFVSEYSEEIETSYESEESVIEQAESSEESATETQSQTEATDAAEDTDGDGTPDASDADDDNDGTPDEVHTDDGGDAPADDGEPDGGGDDAGGEDDSGGDDGGDDAGGDGEG